MSSGKPGGGRPPPDVRLAHMRAAAKSKAGPKTAPAKPPKPQHVLRPPAPSKTIQNHTMINAAKAKAGAAGRTTAPAKAKAAVKSAKPSSKAAFAKATAKRPTRAFNRAVSRGRGAGK